MDLALNNLQRLIRHKTRPSNQATICIKMDLALNNLQRLICHKTQPSNPLTICIKMDLALNNLQRLICHKTQSTNQPTILWNISYPLIHFLCYIAFFNVDSISAELGPLGLNSQLPGKLQLHTVTFIQIPFHSGIEFFLSLLC